MGFKTGDRVSIVDREVDANDVKTGLYYQYFAGLQGTIDRIYDDGSVCVDVDIDSLDPKIRQRHLDTQEAERQQWLDSLSDEVKNRLTAAQKQLKISYKILVSNKDLQACKGGPNSTGESKKKSSKKEEKSGGADRVAPPPHIEAATTKKENAEEVEVLSRKTEADFAAAEEEFLKSLQQRKNK